MSKTALEHLQTLLKAHPNARPVTHRRRGRSQAQASSVQHQASRERHQRKCRICRHPDRDAIELDFLRWRSSVEIAKTYGLADHSSVCRHARATGLFRRRDQTIGYALEPILEQAEDVFMRLTPNTVISAVAAYSKINDEGKRTRLRPVNNFYYVTPDEYQDLLGSSVQPQASRPNRPIPKLEGDPIH